MYITSLHNQTIETHMYKHVPLRGNHHVQPLQLQTGQQLDPMQDAVMPGGWS